MALKKPAIVSALPKARSGIRGLDEITGGGLPRGRPTLVCGSAGAGKTLFSVEFLVRGIEMGEPGVFMAFEETAEELAQNVASLGFDLERLSAQKKLLVDFVRVERAEIEETGEYDLEGLFVRLGHAIDTVGAKRVVLDTIESLFAGLSNANAAARGAAPPVPLAEGPPGDGGRHGRARGGSPHPAGARGIRLGLRDPARPPGHGPGLHAPAAGREVPGLRPRHERVSLPGRRRRLLGPAHHLAGAAAPGVRRAGVQRHTAAGRHAGRRLFPGQHRPRLGDARVRQDQRGRPLRRRPPARRGERCLFFAFEESPQQLARNMGSIGMDLGRWRKRGLLRLESARPAVYGLETHLAFMHRTIREFRPAAVLVDPITDFTDSLADNKAMLTRLIDFLKMEGITAVFTSLTSAGAHVEQSEAGVSSLIDTWIVLRDLEREGRRYRALCVLKSRGMPHSHDIREFRITRRGIDIGEDQPGLSDPPAEARIRKRPGIRARKGAMR